MSLLQEILRVKKTEVENAKRRRPEEKLRKLIEDNSCVSLKKSIDDSAQKYGFGIIGEIKRKSPSMGDMTLKNVKNALSVYNSTDTVAGISVLTDSEFFGQHLDNLEDVKAKTDKPVLRKDFIIDEYQVLEAKAYGADAILLMSSVHDHLKTIKTFHAIYDFAVSLGMEVLIEFGMETQPSREFIPKDATLFGINARRFVGSPLSLRYIVSNFLSKFGFKDMTTNSDIHFKLYEKLMKYVGQSATVVAESGIVNPIELNQLRQVGYKGALIGTGFLKSNDIRKTLEAFDGHIKTYKKQAPHKAKLKHQIA